LFVFFSFFEEELLEGGDELDIGSRSDVEMSIEFFLKPIGPYFAAGMDVFE
jgi:hypothetical protein